MEEENDVSCYTLRRSSSSNDSKMSMEGWWMVQTMVLLVLTMFLTARMTMAAARASSPDVGSSMKMMLGLATSSTAIVRRFLCSTERPLTPGRPTCRRALTVSDLRHAEKQLVLNLETHALQGCTFHNEPGSVRILLQRRSSRRSV